MGDFGIEENDSVTLEGHRTASEIVTYEPTTEYDNRPKPDDLKREVVPIPERSWQSRSACNGLHMFMFAYGAERKPEKVERIAKAKRICGVCAVRAECIELALSRTDWGDDCVIGGMDSLERKAERNRRLNKSA